MLLQEYLKDLQKNNCKLVPVDKSFMKSIKDYKEMYYKEHKYNYYYTLICDNEKVAITGVLLEHNIPFFQIAIHQKYRGKNLLNVCTNLIASKHNIKVLNSTISKDNKSSIKAHLKAGFKRIPIEKEKELQQKNKLQNDQVRLIKTYK